MASLSQLTRGAHKGRQSKGTLASLTRKTHKGRGSRGTTKALLRGHSNTSGRMNIPSMLEALFVADDLNAKRVDELRDIAQELDITGRSEMNKAELVDAIGRARATEDSIQRGKSELNSAATKAEVSGLELRVNELVGRVERLERSVTDARETTLRLQQTMAPGPPRQVTPTGVPEQRPRDEGPPDA